MCTLHRSLPVAPGYKAARPLFVKRTPWSRRAAQGTLLLLHARKKTGLLGCFNGSYWWPTLFNLHGRAIPWTDLTIYLACSAGKPAVNVIVNLRSALFFS